MRWLLLFQSTLSVRRATKASDCPLTPFQISIHALRKESDGVRGFQHFIPLISIHALRKESDAFVTASCNTITISIHALRKESDLSGKISSKIIRYFNPRSP